MTDWHAAWAAELDRLDLTLDEAEALLRVNDPAHIPDRSPAPWAPQVRGVLPEDLLPRARLIHERQLAVARALAEAALSAQRQLDVARVIRDTTLRPDIPVYVDVSA